MLVSGHAQCSAPLPALAPQAPCSRGRHPASGGCQLARWHAALLPWGWGRCSWGLVGGLGCRQRAARLRAVGSGAVAGLAACWGKDLPGRAGVAGAGQAALSAGALAPQWRRWQGRRSGRLQLLHAGPCFSPAACPPPPPCSALAGSSVRARARPAPWTTPAPTPGPPATCAWTATRVRGWAGPQPTLRPTTSTAHGRCAARPAARPPLERRPLRPPRPAGKLRLVVNSWAGAEVQLPDSLGYGVYNWKLSYNPAAATKHSAAGFFLYAARGCPALTDRPTRPRCPALPCPALPCPAHAPRRLALC